MAAAERRFHAMGGEAHVVVVGGHRDLIDAAEERVADLEARWSRFRQDSELSLLNAMPGMPAVVSRETFELVEKAAFAWQRTGGRFDPTVLGSLAAIGYDRSFDTIAAGGPIGRHGEAPGCHGIDLNRDNLAITLPYGVTIDPGGIGKGLGADIVARELVSAGATGAMVNLGGDVRVIGESPDGDGWTVLVEDPHDHSEEMVRVQLTDGGVATSSRLERRWQRDGAEYHHLIDPETGLPFAGEVVAVTVVAGEAWWAEVMTKAVFAAGVERATQVLERADALVVTADGRRYRSPGFEEVAA
jgi:thiamine biosynthesis lipoprotein